MVGLPLAVVIAHPFYVPAQADRLFVDLGERESGQGTLSDPGPDNFTGEASTAVGVEESSIVGSVVGATL